MNYSQSLVRRALAAAGAACIAVVATAAIAYSSDPKISARDVTYAQAAQSQSLHSVARPQRRISELSVVLV